MAIATVANVHHGEDRNVERMATWLICRFRECPPGSIDPATGLILESEDSS